MGGPIVGHLAGRPGPDLDHHYQHPVPGTPLSMTTPPQGKALFTNVRPPMTPRSIRCSTVLGERVQAGGRVVAAQPEVEREVVAGIGADHQEPQIVLGGHPEQVRATAKHWNQITDVHADVGDGP